MENSILILSREELDSFKSELLSEIKKLTEENAKNEWLRSVDVRKMLKISDSTLQTMRINSTVPAYKLGTTWFYKYSEIMEALEDGRA